MHMLSHASNCICQMGSPDTFSTDMSELSHLENIKEAFCPSNQVGYDKQMHWYNDRYTGIAYI